MKISLRLIISHLILAIIGIIGIFMAQGADSQSTSMIFVVVLVGAGIVAPIIMVKSIAQPIEELTEILDDVVTSNNFSARSEIEGDDEVGELAGAFDDMMEHVEGVTKDMETTLRAHSSGDYSKQVNLTGGLQGLGNEINGSAHTVLTTMSALDSVMSSMAEGNFKARMSANIKGSSKKKIDEAMLKMDSTISNINDVMTAVADGDLKRRVTVDASGDLNTLKNSINSSIQSLGTTLVNVRNDTLQVASGAGETNTAVNEVSRASTNQLESINQLAQAINQTSTAIAEVARSAEEASAAAQDALRMVNDGQNQMRHMVQVVNAISDNSGEINKITEVISKIADQTHLLSLNATIEAASAGEHGKGFAVVAEEVRKLASNSANSVGEITSLVEQAIRETKAAVKTAAEVNDEMEKIAQTAKKSDEMLMNIATAMEEQSAIVKEISENVNTLRVIGESNATAAEEISSTMIGLTKLTDRTKSQVEMFRV